jgi:molybdopterin-biosynthesis enzyme MoeA-like protein
MATIDDLSIEAISTMSREALIEHIMNVRRIRRIYKPTTKKKAAPKKAVKSTSDIINMLSPAQTEALLKKLEG